ncbi:MAG: hypothetical protein ACREQY_20520, partial [Candidatus Binatia bacterium]
MTRKLVAAAALAMIVFPVESSRSQPAPRGERPAAEYRQRGQENVILPEEIPTPRVLPEPEIPVPERAAPPAPQHEPKLWRLFRQRRYGEVRREIRRIRNSDPKWKPPARLLWLLAEAEDRQAIARAANERRWAEVIGLA